VICSTKYISIFWKLKAPKQQLINVQLLLFSNNKILISLKNVTVSNYFRILTFIKGIHFHHCLIQIQMPNKIIVDSIDRYIKKVVKLTIT